MEPEDALLHSHVIFIALETNKYIVQKCMYSVQICIYTVDTAHIYSTSLYVH